MTKEQRRKLTKKLSSGMDISQEEADSVFIYLISKKRNINFITSWFNEVYKAMTSGMEGNYISTVPLFSLDCEIEPLEGCVRKLKHDDKLSLIKASKKFLPDKLFRIPGVHVKKNDKNYKYIEIKRAGIAKRLTPDLSFCYLPSMSKYALKYLNYFLYPDGKIFFSPEEKIKGYVMAEICIRKKIDIFCASFDPWSSGFLSVDAYVKTEDYEELKFYEGVSEEDVLSFVDKKTAKSVKNGIVDRSVILTCAEAMEKLAQMKKDLATLPLECPELLEEK